MLDPPSHNAVCLAVLASGLGLALAVVAFGGDRPFTSIEAHAARMAAGVLAAVFAGAVLDLIRIRRRR